MADDPKKAAANNQFRKLRQAEDGKRAMTEYENAAIANRAKTARLKALRLARDRALEARARAGAFGSTSDTAVLTPHRSPVTAYRSDTCLV